MANITQQLHNDLSTRYDLDSTRFDPVVINAHIGQILDNMAGLAKHLEEARDRIAILEQEVQALKLGKDIDSPLIIHRHQAEDPSLGIPKPAPVPVPPVPTPVTPANEPLVPIYLPNDDKNVPF